MKKRPVVAVVGMATVDHLYALERHPVEDSTNRVLEYTVVVGGQAGRASIAAARLGAEVRLLATRGTGVHGDLLAAELAREGVDCTWIVSDVDSQHSAVLVARDGASRTTIWLPQPRADERVFAALDAVLDGADVVLLDCTDEPLTYAVVDAAERLGVPSVVDTGSWKGWSPAVVERVTHVVAPAKYFHGQDPDRPLEEALDQWSRRGPEVVAATLGADGGLYVAADRRDVAAYQAAPVLAVDTCGAGDTFHGAYAFGVGAGLDPAKCIEVAKWSAGLKAQSVGNDSIPDWPTVAAAIERAKAD